MSIRKQGEADQCGLEELEKNAYGKVALDLGFIMTKTFVRPRGIQREFQMKE